MRVTDSSLTVLLGKSQGQLGQEFVDGHMDLRGELLGEDHGHAHQHAVSQELGWTENKRNHKNNVEHKWFITH